MSTHNTIVCPNCKHEFSIETAIAKDLQEEIENQLKKEYNQKWQDLEKKRKQEQEEMLRKERELQDEQYRNRMRDLEERNLKMRQEMEESWRKQQEEQAAQLRKKLETENAQLIETLRRENQENETRLKAAREKEIEFLEKEAQLRKRQEELELEQKKRELETRQKLEEEISKRETEKNQLVVLEYQKKLEDQHRLIEEMKRKSEQGSMQLQGEIQELAIEDYIRQRFPHDNLEEIRKGARGGDCLQIVINDLGRTCGKIYYESKRTKEFQPAWIEKFKADMREAGADIGVIVTQTMPKDMERFGEREGIWVCTFEEFKALSAVLRDTLLRVQRVMATQENKGDRMQLLYDYLTGNDFRMRIEAIVEGFSTMKQDLERERNAMTRIWKTREKQIEKVLSNTIEMFGNIKGIGGSAIADIRQLELGSGDDDPETED